MFSYKKTFSFNSMKNLLMRLIIGLSPFATLGQKSNHIEINGAINYCPVEILNENNDTIRCIIKSNCDEVNFDLTKNATWIVYMNDTTNLFEIASYYNGKQTKTHTEYYKNGILKTQSNYENGELIGPYLSLYQDGRIKWSGLYSNGIFIGSQYKYWDNGQIAEIRILNETHRYGILNVFYDTTGKQISEKKYLNLCSDN